MPDLDFIAAFCGVSPANFPQKNATSESFSLFLESLLAYDA